MVQTYFSDPVSLVCKRKVTDINNIKTLIATVDLRLRKHASLTAVELCLAAIQTSYKKSALSNARTTFLSPIVTSGKQQQPTVLKVPSTSMFKL